MLAHREQSICYIESCLFCGSMTKILSTMTKKKNHGFLWCVLLVLKLKTEEHLFIGFLGCCGPHKLLVQCGPYKRILC